MAKAKEIGRQIKSVSNTKKITRTMEMVAGAKIVKAKERIEATRPYAVKMMDLLQNVAQYVPLREHPLLEAHEAIETVLIVSLNSNRGLAGAFNTNILKRVAAIAEREKTEGRKVKILSVGKKGYTFFKFRKFDIVNAYLDIGDQPKFSEAKAVADEIIKLYTDKEVNKVYLVFNHFKTIVEQFSVEHQLLPIQEEKLIREKEKAGAGAIEGLYIFEPEPPKKVLDKLMPAYVDAVVYRAILESAASEQGARRTAMKAATDNAGKMIENLTRKFNQARQAQITMEIAEIVGGAEALAKK